MTKRDDLLFEMYWPKGPSAPIPVPQTEFPAPCLISPPERSSKGLGGCGCQAACPALLGRPKSTPMVGVSENRPFPFYTLTMCAYALGGGFIGPGFWFIFALLHQYNGGKEHDKDDDVQSRTPCTDGMEEHKLHVDQVEDGQHP